MRAQLVRARSGLEKAPRRQVSGERVRLAVASFSTAPLPRGVFVVGSSPSV